MHIESSAFANQAPIPARYTADGQDISPPLRMADVPAAARQLALIVDDPDAPRKEPWVHWLLYNIPADTAQLPENLPKEPRPSSPAGALQGKNSWDRSGYGGPQPPKGHGVHHYHFKLYALDQPLSLAPGLDKEALLRAIHGHVIAEAELVGTYKR